MAFKDKLKFYRSQTDLTQAELAKKLNLTQKTISAWEVGRSEPTMSEIYTLCNIFDCTLEDLTDTRKRKVGEISKEDVIVKINDMTMDELEEIERLIDLQIQKLKETKKLEEEKQYLEKRLAEMQKRIDAYGKK